MLLWVLYNDFGFNKEQLHKVCDQMSYLHDCLKDKKLHMTLDDVIQTLGEECDIHFQLPKPVLEDEGEDETEEA